MILTTYVAITAAQVGAMVIGSMKPIVIRVSPRMAHALMSVAVSMINAVDRVTAVGATSS